MILELKIKRAAALDVQNAEIIQKTLSRKVDILNKFFRQNFIGIFLLIIYFTIKAFTLAIVAFPTLPEG